MKRLIVIAALVTACATPPDLPEEVQDADGVGGATAKVEFVKWLGQLLLTAVGNVTINVKVDHGSTIGGDSKHSGDKQPAQTGAGSNGQGR